MDDITITVLESSRPGMSICVDPTIPAREVCAIVESIMEYPPNPDHTYSLVFDGRVIPDATTLRDSGVENHSELSFLGRPSSIPQEDAPLSSYRPRERPSERQMRDAMRSPSREAAAAGTERNEGSSNNAIVTGAPTVPGTRAEHDARQAVESVAAPEGHGRFHFAFEPDDRFPDLWPRLPGEQVHDDETVRFEEPSHANNADEHMDGHEHDEEHAQEDMQERVHEHTQERAHEHTQGHSHSRTQGHTHEPAHRHTYGNEPGRMHWHTHGQTRGHTHGHMHGHTHRHTHEHTHGHTHGHTHRHMYGHMHGNMHGERYMHTHGHAHSHVHEDEHRRDHGFHGSHSIVRVPESEIQSARVVNHLREVGGFGTQSNGLRGEPAEQNTHAFVINTNGDGANRFEDAFDVIVHSLRAVGFSQDAGETAAMAGASAAVGARAWEEPGVVVPEGLERAWVATREAQRMMNHRSEGGSGTPSRLPGLIPISAAERERTREGQNGSSLHHSRTRTINTLREYIFPTMSDVLGSFRIHLGNASSVLGETSSEAHLSHEQNRQMREIRDQLLTLGELCTILSAVISTVLTPRGTTGLPTLAERRRQIQESMGGTISGAEESSRTVGTGHEDHPTISDRTAPTSRISNRARQDSLGGVVIGHTDSVLHLSADSVPELNAESQVAERPASGGDSENQLAARADSVADAESLAVELPASAADFENQAITRPALHARPDNHVRERQRDNSGSEYIEDDRAMQNNRDENSSYWSTVSSPDGDFLLRILAYYAHSMNDEEPEWNVDDSAVHHTADSVLNGLFGGGRRAEPTLWCLRTLRMLMQCLTPYDFHLLLRGDFSSLGSVGINFWTEVKKYAREDRSESNDEVASSFADVINDQLHGFVHVMGNCRDEMHGGSDFGGHSGHDVCMETMQALEPTVDEFAMLVQLHHRDPDFAHVCKDFLYHACGRFAAVCTLTLDVDWNSFFVVFRRALWTVGTDVLGAQSALAPVMFANLFSRRWRSCYEQYFDPTPLQYLLPDDRGFPSTAPNRNGLSALPRVVSGPSVPDSCLGLRRRILLAADRSHLAAARPRSAADETGTSSRPDVNVQSPPPVGLASGSRDCSCASSTTSSRSGGDRQGDANALSPRSASLTSGGRECSCTTSTTSSCLGGDSQEAATDTLGSMDLNDDDLDDLVAEMDGECNREDGTDQLGQTEVAFADDALGEATEEAMDAVMEELEQEEARGGGAGSVKPARSAAQRPRVSASFLPSMGRAGFPSRSMPGVAGAMGSNRTSFASSTSAVRPSQTTAVPFKTDDFDQALGKSAGAQWRRVVKADEAKLRTVTHGPLSRAYRGENSTLRPLSAETATEYAAEDTRGAAREAGLSAEETASLESVVRENGELYLQEMERALRTRVTTDSDFDPQRFPAAAERFGQQN